MKLGQRYKKVFVLWLALAVVLLPLGCSKKLAPLTQSTTPGKSGWKTNREQRKRARQAARYKRHNERLTGSAERKRARTKQEGEKAAEKLRQRHIENQAPEVQQRMKETKKEADQNNGRRSLRQRLGLWKYKK